MILTCVEYKTDGDRAVKHEKWPISSFGMSVSQSVSESVTMIRARDASASEKCWVGFCKVVSPGGANKVGDKLMMPSLSRVGG